MKRWSNEVVRNYINNRRTFNEIFLSRLSVLYTHMLDIHLNISYVVFCVCVCSCLLLFSLLFWCVLFHSLFQFVSSNMREQLECSCRDMVESQLHREQACAHRSFIAFHRLCWLFIMYYCLEWLTSQLYTLSTSKLWWSIISLLFSFSSAQSLSPHPGPYVCIMVMPILAQGFRSFSLSLLSLYLYLSMPRRWTHIFLSIVYEYRGDCKWPGFSGPHSVFMVDVCICEWVCSLDYVHIFQWYDRCGDCYSMAMFQNTVLTKNTDVLVYSSLSALCASILGLCVRLLNDEIRKFLMV